MADYPEEEVITLGRTLIELISKSSGALSSRVLALIVESRTTPLDDSLRLPYSIDVYLLCTQLHVAYNATINLCEDLIKQTPLDSDSIVMKANTFAVLLELSTTTKSWENELLKKHGLSLTLQ